MESRKWYLQGYSIKDEHYMDENATLHDSESLINEKSEKMLSCFFL